MQTTYEYFTKETQVQLDTNTDLKTFCYPTVVTYFVVYCYFILPFYHDLYISVCILCVLARGYIREGVKDSDV